MAYANSRFGYHHTQPEAAISERRPAYFDEDDSAILDPTILDSDIMQSPVDARIRKSSFANNNGILSPEGSQTWDYHYAGGLQIEPSSAGAPGTFHDDHNGFVRQGPTHISTNFPHQQQPQHWQFEQGSGHCTPTENKYIPPPPSATFDGVHGQQYVHHRHDSARNSFSQHAPQPHHFGAPHSEGTFIPANQVQTPMSPHSHQDWMSMAQQEVECRPMSKRMRPASPPRTSVDVQRKDGIRKKNGRIEIPHERNIQTIDELIENTSDEDLLKELKQQKRLLRNREAALASRQRKKKHTEDLESQQKSSSNVINGLESRIHALQIEAENHEHRNQMLFHRNQELERMIQSMQEEKSEIARAHLEETSNLRKRIQILMDQVDNGFAPAMSAAPSSTGLTDFNADMEALHMENDDWTLLFDNDLQSDGQNDFTFDAKPQPTGQSHMLEKKPSSSTVVPTSSKKPTDPTSDQPIPSAGLVFFLLLCGAFVASKPANSSASDLPEVPEDVRAAAPAVLDNLLAEASPSSLSSSSRNIYQPSWEPAPSSVPHTTRSRSRLEHMHRQITSPTRQQEIDSAFSLTPAQYASITNMDHIEHAAPSRPRRPALAEALANMQQNQNQNQNSKAEVYTRSLLWDQIPPNVVEQFREMVRDHNEIEARQQQSQRQSHDDMFTFKVEQ